MACGLQDGLLPKSDEFAAFLKENGIDVTYETGPGAHEWDFGTDILKSNRMASNG